MNHTGTIHAYDPRKGYGRIKCKDFGAAHLLFYRSDAAASVPMHAGTPVQFEVEQQADGRLLAVTVRRKDKTE